MPMREKTLHRAAVAFSVLYGPTALGPALEARADPPAHRKEAAKAEDRTHDPEGERDEFPTESAQPLQVAAGGATGAPGDFVRNISESVGPVADNVASGPPGPRRIFEPRTRVGPVVQDPRWQYDPETQHGTLTCSKDPAHVVSWSGSEKQSQHDAALILILRHGTECGGCEDLGVFV
jgi:hypothetical protein